MSIEGKIVSFLQPYAKELLLHHMVAIPFFRDTRCFEQTALELEVLLLRESKKYINSWRLDLSQNGKADDGIIVRKGKHYDDKTFFHFRPSLTGQLSRRNVNFERYFSLIEHATRDYHICKEHMLALGAAIDREAPGFHFYERLRAAEAQNESVYRILWYRSVGKKLGDILAKEHTDRSCITYHLWDRTAGFRYGEDKLYHLSEPDTILAFWGDKAKIVTNGHAEPLLHDVVNCVQTETPRMASVFFGHTAM
jgi:hypothetical protein